MASKIETAVRNASKLAAVAAKREERLVKSRSRMETRLQKANLAIARANAAIVKANERLAKAKARLSDTQLKMSELLNKQSTAAADAQKRAADAKERAENMAAQPSKPVSVGGTVETEQGETRTITSKAGKLIAKLVGRQSSGSFAPLDCAEAQSILSAIDARIGQGGSVGDIFTVRLKGRKTEIVFSIEAEGLAFQVGKLVAA